MSKKDTINILQQMLDNLHKITKSLSADMELMKSILDREQFIPDELNGIICDKLMCIGDIQKKFETDYLKLEIGILPDLIPEAEQKLLNNEKELAEKEGQRAAFEWFFRLYSEDDEVESKLSEEQKWIHKLIQNEETDQELLQRTFEKVKLLLEVIEEEDKYKKFEMSLDLKNYYDSAILAHLAMGQIFVREDVKTEEFVEGAQFQNTVANEDLPEEKSEWEVLGISNPEKIIESERTECLEISRSEKARKKFGVNEFKGDMKKQPCNGKVFGMVLAYKWNGLTAEAARLYKRKFKDVVEYAIQRLYQYGYLDSYTVEPYEPLYCLSERGRKAFHTKEALNYIKQKGYEIIAEDSADYVENTANAALARIFSMDAIRIAHFLNPEYEFNGMRYIMWTNFVFRLIFKLVDEKDFVFATIVSDNPRDFLQYKEEIRKFVEDLKEGTVLAIIAKDQQQARNIAVWTQGFMPESMEVCYMAARENEILMAGTDIPLEIRTAELNREYEDEKGGLEQHNIPEVSSEEPGEMVSEVLKEKGDRAESVVQEEHIDSKEKVVVDEETQQRYHETYLRMLCGEKYYAATAYLKAVSKAALQFKDIYQQLAYALNDPLENCSYNSNQIFNIFFSSTESASEYYVLAAALRNYFLDQYSFDYMLQQLKAALTTNTVLSGNVALDRVLYELFSFKSLYNCGIDRYADYREKERADWEKRLEETRRDAKEYYENCVIGNLKENASHKRFLETRRLIFAPNGELAECLKFVMKNERNMADFIHDFAQESFVKDNTEVCSGNIDDEKIHEMLDEYWIRAGRNMRLVKKTSDLMSSLRMNLFKLVKKVATVLCDYVALMNSFVMNEKDPALLAYKKVRNTLLLDMQEAIELFKQEKSVLTLELAGKNVLCRTLEELISRLNGSFQEYGNKYFYMEFLRNSRVLLGDDYMPFFEDVSELPELTVIRRIELHCEEPGMDWKDRLEDIFNGQDDYGSAQLILRYMENRSLEIQQNEKHIFDIEKALTYAKTDMENKRGEFIEDLELAQSYGQIDNTEGDYKETIVQIMDVWYQWALETKNYGFFVAILEAFKEKIKKDAQIRSMELRRNLSSYLEKGKNSTVNEAEELTIKQINERIEKQNYAAAEDLLNRLVANDIDVDNDMNTADYFLQFLDEYEVIYRKTANSGMTLRSLAIGTARSNKDTKGAERLLQSWPKGNAVGVDKIKDLLYMLGFQTEEVKRQTDIQGKIENYTVNLKRPKNGRKSNYKHPIAAFGSEAEEKGFRVVCLFGKTNAERLLDTCREIGSAKNTLIILDYALTLADRRKLARKVKAELHGKIFTVIDRVVLVFLANHYMETAINRMLMCIIMPFAYCQPYIDKSADIMPQEIFMGRKNELEKIESPTGVNIVYGGRQLGKSALLRMAQKDINMNENGDRAIIVDIKGMDYKRAAKKILSALYDEGILKDEIITEDWSELARSIKNRLRYTEEKIPFLLLMLDEADAFIESCETVGYQPFDALKDIQSVGSKRFKFVVAGLRNIVRFKKDIALGNNSVLAHLESLTVTPFKSTEARELLEIPLYYLGFRFEKDNETEVLISTILGTTNYFPGLLQLYCTKLIEAMKKDYAGYSESETPPYIVRKEHIKKVLAEQGLQQEIREKFFITLKEGEDDYYYILALLVAYHYHENREQNGCSVKDIMELAEMLDIEKITVLSEEKVSALLEEMRELNVLQLIGDARYRFARYSFCQMMGSVQQLEDEFYKYME